MTPVAELGDQLSVTKCAALLTPMPKVVTEFGLLFALLLTVTLPVTLPVACGANITFMVADWPAAMVAPPMPLATLKPLPLTKTPDTVTLELPVFLMLTPSVLDFPTTSLPKLRLEVERKSVRVVELPLPFNEMVTVGLLPLLLMMIVPVLLPVVVGANDTVRFMVTPDPIHKGMYRLLISNPVPLRVALESTKVEPPVFFS